MSPDDLAVVNRSWTELRGRRTALVDRLTVTFGELGPTHVAQARAVRLFESTTQLVGLLDTPSQLASRARTFAAAWPGAPAPSFAVDGRAWMRAASEVSPAWSSDDEQAWRRAWLLLSDVLAEESLSPF